MPLIDAVSTMRGNVARIVLQIAVGGRDEPAARELESCGERRRLAEVAPEPNHADARVARLQSARIAKLSSVLPSSTTMSSYGRPHAVERLGELAVQLHELRRFVANRDDDGELGVT